MRYFKNSQTLDYYLDYFKKYENFVNNYSENSALIIDMKKYIETIILFWRFSYVLV